MSHFVRFEPGELACQATWDNWTTMRSPWIVPASAVDDIAYEIIRDADGRTGIQLHIDATGPTDAGMGYVWLGTKDDLWLRLNGIGPVGLDAAKLATVLQRLLVEADADMELNGAVQPVVVEPAAGEDVQPAVTTTALWEELQLLTEAEVLSIAMRWDLRTRAQVYGRLIDMSEGDCRQELRLARALTGPAEEEPPADLEAAIARGHVVIERQPTHGAPVMVTWIRGGQEWATVIGYPWRDGHRNPRTPWQVLTVDQVQDLGIWDAACSTWAQRPRASEWLTGESGSAEEGRAADG